MYALVYFAEHRVQSVIMFTSLTSARIGAEDFIERTSACGSFTREPDEFPTWTGEQGDVLSIFPVSGSRG